MRRLWAWLMRKDPPNQEVRMACISVQDFVVPEGYILFSKKRHREWVDREIEREAFIASLKAADK